MTPSEFKAWFDGFTEAFDRLPTKAQWARVKERVAEIDGKTVTERVYIDRYWRYHQPYYGGYYGLSGLSGQAQCSTLSSIGFRAGLQGQGQNLQQSQSSGAAYNSTAAMYALGKADATNLAAA